MSRLPVAVLALLVIGGLFAVAPPATAHDTAVALDVAVEPTQPAAGDNATMAVTLDSLSADGDSMRVTDVTLYNGTGDDADELDHADVNTWVTGGESERWDLYAELDEKGERELRVEVEMFSQEGDKSTITRTVPVTVVDPHPSLALASDPVGPSGETDLSLTLANGANVNATGVDVTLSSSDVTVGHSHHVVSSLAPGAATDLTVPVSEASAGPVAVTAEVSYTTAGGDHRRYERTLDANVEPVDNPARISLTGVRVEQEGRTLSISGSASNPGATNASGAEIRALSGEHVAPGNSRASFFVGDVAASDFTSFEVNARLTDTVNETIEIPVEVEYAVDGERITRERTIQYTPTSESNDQRTQQGGLPLVYVGAGLLLVLGVVGWRRYR